MNFKLHFLIPMLSKLLITILIGSRLLLMPNEIGTAIQRASREFQVSPQLIVAVIYQESKGNRYAFRYEPNFEKKYLLGKKLKGFIPPQSECNTESEIKLRASSIGPMQILGQTARELGFKGHLLELTKPEEGIYWGTKYLAQQLNKYGDTERALLGYNGGGNLEYPKEVLAHLDAGNGQSLLLIG